MQTHDVKMAKILLVEDEADLAMLIREWLENDVHLVEHVSSGSDALHCLLTNNYDLVILDLLLPNKTGIEVCREYRSRKGDTPILMLTAKSDIEDKEAGFVAGADDYLTKPFHLKELMARVRVLLRRPLADHESSLRVGSVVMDTVECKVTRDGEEVHLLPKEYRLLEFLMRHPNQVFSTESLFDRVWESDTMGSMDTVRGHIMRLRTKLDTAGRQSIISTVRRLGYKLNSR
ncbi:MAG TPA: response regulator transcription factor [Trichormus sp.]|jgi:two-component system OmpR family response regulator